MVTKSYYEILGTSENATQDEIERRYKHLARQHHPDRGGDPEVMKAINEAYRVLGNETTRRSYDSHQKQAYESVWTPPSQPLTSPAIIIPNTTLGRLLVAVFTLFGGLLLLFLVSIFYIRFMWPIYLLAVLLVLLGVWKVHGVMIFARNDLPSSHLLRRYTWLQELVFLGIAALGLYVIYILTNAI